MNWKSYLVRNGLIFCLCFGAFTSLQAGEDNRDFAASKTIILMRKIGHEVLLQAGDSTSRVMPVKQISPNEYLIALEHQFSFHPDSLIELIRTVVNTHTELPDSYIVNVIECESEEIIYGYAILKNREDEILACAGRPQPEKCYNILIRFASPAAATSFTANSDVSSWFGGMALILGLFAAFLGFLFFQKQPQTSTAAMPAQAIISLGQYQFYHEEHYLIWEEQKIELTSKEANLLHFFCLHPNQVIKRTKLQKEVWGTEGIVSRSLDMFISKLRKKLSGDSSVQLVNIHGRGYKLELPTFAPHSQNS